MTEDQKNKIEQDRARWAYAVNHQINTINYISTDYGNIDLSKDELLRLQSFLMGMYLKKLQDTNNLLEHPRNNAYRTALPTSAPNASLSE